MDFTRLVIMSICEEVEELWPSYTTGGHGKWYKSLWKAVSQILKKLNIDLPYDVPI